MRGLLLASVAVATILVIGCDDGAGARQNPTPSEEEGLSPFGVLASPARDESPTSAITRSPDAGGSPRLLWRFEVAEDVESSPTVVDGVVYISAEGYLYALDATTGEELWRAEAGNDFSTPAVVGETVYVAGGYDDYLYALDSRTGQQRWRFKISGTGTSAAVLGDVVYIASQDDHLYALDADTGQERWRWRAADGFTSSPVVVEDTVYVFSGSYSAEENQGHVFALDAATGEERWRFKVNDAMASELAVVGGVVYIGASEEYVYALGADTGREIWRSKVGSVTLSSPAVQDGTVYIGNMSGQVHALDAATGETRWRFSTGFWVMSSPAVVDGVVYIGSFDKYVYALDAATGAERWRLETGDAVASSPAVEDGVVYVGSYDGYLYAITAGNGEFTGRQPDINCTLPDDIKSYRFTVTSEMHVPQLEEEIEQARQQLEDPGKAESQDGEEAPSEEPGLGEGLSPFMLVFLADMRMEVAFVAPDRAELHLRLGDLEIAGVATGEKSWVKYGNERWEESSEEAAGLNLLGDLCLGFSFPDVTGFEAEEETTNGVSTRHYHVDQNDLPQLVNFLGEGPLAPEEIVGLLDKVIVDLWLAEDGDWPVRMEAEGRGKDDQGNEASLSLFMEVKDLNDPDIRIEPPIEGD